jgi:predicted nucleotidyltransferase
VEILGKFCDYLCFGSETGDASSLMETARALLSPDFPPALRTQLDKGLSFPAARQAALAEMGIDAALLANPNDILAVEYCKAILSRKCAMHPLPLRREGGYHDACPDAENPSATSIRQLMLQNKGWNAYIPVAAQDAFRNAPIYTLEAGERAILARLRTMTDADFEALPFGSEGLWRKLMHTSRACSSLEDILTATKSKRYTRTRLDRMVMCAYLGITAELLRSPVPYVRVLGLRTSGIPALKKAREIGLFPHIGEKTGQDYEKLEKQWDDLYGLFCQDAPAPSGQTGNRRIYLFQE